MHSSAQTRACLSVCVWLPAARSNGNAQYIYLHGAWAPSPPQTVRLTALAALASVAVRIFSNDARCVRIQLLATRTPRCWEGCCHCYGCTHTRTPTNRPRERTQRVPPPSSPPPSATPQRALFPFTLVPGARNGANYARHTITTDLCRFNASQIYDMRFCTWGGDG